MCLKETFTSSQIKEALITNCIGNNSIELIPYILSKNCEVKFRNKIRFYGYLKELLNCAHKKKKGELFLKIEKYNWVDDEDIVYYNFYDGVHIYDHLSIEVTERENKLILDVMPF